MKKSLSFFFILTLVLLETLSSKTFIGLDLRSLDFFFLNEGVRIDGEVGFEYKNIVLNVPLRFGWSREENLYYTESGLTVIAYPIDGVGLFMEGSLLKVGYLFGTEAPKDGEYISAEGSIGYDFYVGSFYFRPRLTFRSTLSSESEKALILKKIPQFREVRISLNIGVRI